MNVLEFTVTGNHLEITEDAVTTGGSVNYDKCSFTFDEEWDDFEKTAVFEIGKDSFRVALEDDECFIPSPCIEKEGLIRIGVYGSDDETVIATNSVAHRVEEGIDDLGEWFEEDYSFVLDAVSRMEARVEQYIDNLSDSFENLSQSLISGGSVPQSQTVIEGGDCPDEWYVPENFDCVEDIQSVTGAEELDDYLEYRLEPLRREFPDYVSREQIGTDAAEELPVYAYSFTPENYEKTILLTTCIHGYERMAFFALSNFLDALCRKSEDSRTLSYLKNRVKIIAVPAVNPYSLITGQAFNENGVDINFNFPYRWSDCTKTTKGVSAADQPETQNLIDFVEEICSDKLCAAIDFHLDTDTEAGKSIFYPRFKDNCLSALTDFVNRFNYEATSGTQSKGVLAASVNPTFSNYLADEYGINTCESIWHYLLFGGLNSSANYVKYLEYMVNIVYTMAKNSSFTHMRAEAPFVKHIAWKGGDEPYGIPQKTAPEEMGISNCSLSLKSPCILTMQGTVVIYASSDCTVKIRPVLYQVNSPEQDYDTRLYDTTFQQEIELFAGTHIIPISSVLQAYYTSHNEIPQLKYCEDVRMSIAVCASAASAAQVTAFSVTLTAIPSDCGKPVVISSPTGSASDYDSDETPVQELIYPLESFTAFDTKFSD